MSSTSSLSFAQGMDTFRRRYDIQDRTARIRKMADEMSARARVGTRRSTEEHETERPSSQSGVFSRCHVSNPLSNVDELDYACSTTKRVLLRDEDFWASSHVCGSLASSVDVSDSSYRRIDDSNRHKDHFSREAYAEKIISSNVYADDALLGDSVYGNNLEHLRQRDHDSLLMRATLRHAEMREVAETEMSIQAEDEPTSFSYIRELEKIQTRRSRSSINMQEENSKPQHYPSGIRQLLDGEVVAENSFLPERVDTASSAISSSARRRSLPADVPFTAMTFEEKMDSIRQRFDTCDRNRRINSLSVVDTRMKPAKQEQDRDDAHCLRPSMSTRGVEDSVVDQQEIIRKSHKALTEERAISSSKLESHQDFWSASHICGSLSKDALNTDLVDTHGPLSHLAPHFG